jgi:hypothetical protein
MSNEDTFCTKVVTLSEIYNFIVLSFYIWCREDARKNNIKFKQHNNRGLALIIVDRKYRLCIVSNEDTFTSKL